MLSGHTLASCTATTSQSACGASLVGCTNSHLDLCVGVFFPHGAVLFSPRPPCALPSECVCSAVLQALCYKASAPHAPHFYLLPGSHNFCSPGHVCIRDRGGISRCGAHRHGCPGHGCEFGFRWHLVPQDVSFCAAVVGRCLQQCRPYNSLKGVEHEGRGWLVHAASSHAMG